MSNTPASSYRLIGPFYSFAMPAWTPMVSPRRAFADEALARGCVVSNDVGEVVQPSEIENVSTSASTRPWSRGQEIKKKRKRRKNQTHFPSCASFALTSSNLCWHSIHATALRFGLIF